MGSRYKHIPCPNCYEEVAKQERTSGVIIPAIKPFKVINGIPWVKCKPCNIFVSIAPEQKDSFNPLSLPKISTFR